MGDIDFLRISARGDNFDTENRIFRTGSTKNLILFFILWNLILASLFPILNLFSDAPISVIFALPFIGQCFVFIFALKLRSKLIFAILSIFSMISLLNTIFKLFMGLSDGDWFQRCFDGQIATFLSIITILNAISQLFIVFVLIRASFWEMDASCFCCNCCHFCCCCCPCFDKEREKNRVFIE